ncbi:type IX secretion system membrane protein PorP/SprF [Flavobacteriales bacterium]|jgi:type IX secretion system PorP/SprF family membrane protein|nr:type IX secretion system membrane protein PorP/SprF [Flavobacteriales bacterium]
MKKYFLLFLLFSFVLHSKAQQDPQFSQYIFNNLSFNPGSAGSEQAICATALHRSQWVGFEDAPVSTNLSVQSPISLLHGGLGLNILTDKLGQDEFLSLKLSYAYQIELSEGTLGIGLSAGVIQDGVNGGNIIVQNPDPSIPSSEEKSSGLDLGMGLFYNSENLYLGLSSTHLNQPTISTSIDIIEIKRHYFLTAGYVHQMNEKLDLKPSILVKSEGVTATVDLTSLLEYNKKLWGGVTYRPSSRAVLLLGMHINEDLKFGFSYDMPINEVSAAGTFEFMLGYCFKIDYNKVVKGFKNPRFL